jgi:hypothetical protein
MRASAHRATRRARCSPTAATAPPRRRAAARTAAARGCRRWARAGLRQARPRGDAGSSRSPAPLLVLARCAPTLPQPSRRPAQPNSMYHVMCAGDWSQPPRREWNANTRARASPAQWQGTEHRRRRRSSLALAAPRAAAAARTKSKGMDVELATSVVQQQAMETIASWGPDDDDDDAINSCAPRMCACFSPARSPSDPVPSCCAVLHLWPPSPRRYACARLRRRAPRALCCVVRLNRTAHSFV